MPTTARCACALVLFGALLVVGDASLLSAFAGAPGGWVGVSPALQKQWWGRWPGACGGVPCAAPPTASGLRFPVDVYGQLLEHMYESVAEYQNATDDCGVGLGLAMQQRFASYTFSCTGTPGSETYTPDITNGPCPDMELHMMPLQEPGACAESTEGIRTCNIVVDDQKRAGVHLNCTEDHEGWGGRLCSSDMQIPEPPGYEDYEEKVHEFCGLLRHAVQDADNTCYTSYLGPECGTAYLAFGRRENVAESGFPPCDKDGSVEPGMGAGRHTGRCAVPCVTYRAYDESYWDSGKIVPFNEFCPCLVKHAMLPSALLAAADARPQMQYFLYHQEFMMSNNAPSPGKREIIRATSSRNKNHSYQRVLKNIFNRV
jgi:hypothetical protein